MPVHDWTRVVAGNFHDFHHRWITSLSECLNDGLLPDDYYAMAEQFAEGPKPDILTLERFEDREPDGTGPAPAGALLLEEAPPKVRFTEADERRGYADASDRVTIRHRNGDRVIAHIEIVSLGNKDSRRRVEEFVDKLVEDLEAGTHLMVIDILPPTGPAPRGMHAAFWESFTGEGHGVTDAQPLSLSAYRAATPNTAYFEPVGVGEPLPDMPLFLTPKHYVNVPLEATYQAAWRGVPRRWKAVLEAPSDAAGPSGA